MSSPTTLSSRWRIRAKLFRDHAEEPVARAYEKCAEELEGTSEVQDEPNEQRTQQPPDFNWTWREKLWIAPAETRIGTAELAEAFSRPKSWVYAHTQAEAENPLPHRKLDGTLVFAVGEVRAWLRESEEVLVAGPMESTQSEIRGLMVP